MTYQSPPSPPPPLWKLHPVEAFLALLLISAAALLRLVADPPRPICIRRSVAYSSAPIAMAKKVSAATAIDRLTDYRRAILRQPQASAAPAYGIAPGRTVAELRTMARQQGLAQVGGRPIHKARKADLLTTLELCNG